MKHLTLMFVLCAAATCLSVSQTYGQNGLKGEEGSAEAQVLKAEEEFRFAKLTNDTRTLTRVLADGFSETNQNGNTRDKAQMIELFEGFPIKLLTIDSARLRVTGDTAVVTGTQTEVNSCGTDRMLFTRVYIRERGGWRLLASTQFRDPEVE
jgi:hypothetical protein